MKFLTKCPGCGNSDVVAQDPLFCPKCKESPPADLAWPTAYWRRVNDGISVAIDPKDLAVLFPGREF